MADAASLTKSVACFMALFNKSTFAADTLDATCLCSNGTEFGKTFDPKPKALNPYLRHLSHEGFWQRLRVEGLGFSVGSAQAKLPPKP